MTLLMCDYDRPTLPRDWWKRVQIVLRHQRVTVSWVRVDRTTNGWHVVIACNARMSMMRVVALQAVLGSDWKRENFNIQRATIARRLPPFWRERSNVLYHRHYREVEL
jgi:hypothetical protein